ncbi:MAG: response regulator, partial [Cyanobacteria bacterium CAN_BIN43]|nr:response regulator [Cyanobacteria bacterium CAN_BIN43]
MITDQAQARSTLIEQAISNQFTILVVDDNPTNLSVIVEYLESENFTILIAQDGESGLKRARYAHPDLILLDVLMPGMNGFETCCQLKQDKATSAIPVIFMTALSSTEDKVKGFETGAVDYVTKPVQREELLARIKIHLKLQELSRTLEGKNKLLAEVNQSLEQQVRERTIQLTEALQT